MNSLVELFCTVDDFCKVFVPVWQEQMLASGEKQRLRKRSLNMREIMKILIHFHQSHYRDFKAYYNEYVLERLRSEFRGLVSYSRFVEFIPSVLIPFRRAPANLQCPTCDGSPLQHEKFAHATHGQALVTQTGYYRNDHRSAQEHLADRTLAPSEPE
jgi:hypothetical protein